MLLPVTAKNCKVKVCVCVCFSFCGLWKAIIHVVCCICDCIFVFVFLQSLYIIHMGSVYLYFLVHLVTMLVFYDLIRGRTGILVRNLY